MEVACKLTNSQLNLHHYFNRKEIKKKNIPCLIINNSKIKDRIKRNETDLNSLGESSFYHFPIQIFLGFFLLGFLFKKFKMKVFAILGQDGVMAGCWSLESVRRGGGGRSSERNTMRSGVSSLPAQLQ